MHTGLGSEFIPDFTAEIFDVGRIHLAQDTVLWPERGNTVIPRLTSDPANEFFG